MLGIVCTSLRGPKGRTVSLRRQEWWIPAQTINELGLRTGYRLVSWGDVNCILIHIPSYLKIVQPFHLTHKYLFTQIKHCFIKESRSLGTLKVLCHQMVVCQISQDQKVLLEHTILAPLRGKGIISLGLQIVLEQEEGQQFLPNELLLVPVICAANNLRLGGYKMTAAILWVRSLEKGREDGSFMLHDGLRP